MTDTGLLDPYPQPERCQISGKTVKKGNTTGAPRRSHGQDFRREALLLAAPTGVALAAPEPLDLDMADFAQRLRELRTQRNLTQASIAELDGLGLRAYHRWERGGATPHFQILLKLADRLGVSRDELTGRTNAPDDARIENPGLHQPVRDVDQLTDEERQALILVIDSMVKRAEINRMASSSTRKRATSSVLAGR